MSTLNRPEDLVGERGPQDARVDQPIVQPRLGPVGWLRFIWRQLTSMRTALLLLMLLAVAAIPGSVFPQNRIDPARVESYLDGHPGSGPWLQRIGAIDVFSWGSSTSTPRSGSRRSTCCCSCRWSAACCPVRGSI